MKKNINNIALIMLISCGSIYAQQEKIGTEEVTVKSNYKTELKNLDKLSDNPLEEDQQLIDKQEVNYSIQSFPVASTFVPEKVRAVTLDKHKANTYYSNYASFSAGNYKQFHARLGVVENINKNLYIGGNLGYSQASGIKSNPIDEGYRNGFLNIAVGKKTQNADWQVRAYTDYSRNTWYGIPFEKLKLTANNLSEIDFNRNGQNVGVTAFGTFYGNTFQNMNVKYNYFWDNVGTSENVFTFKPVLNLPIFNKDFQIALQTDYVSTAFDINKQIKDENTSFVFAAEPSFNIAKENMNISLGFGAGYYKSEDKSGNNSNILFYPKINFDLILVRDIVNAYVGANGGVISNTYSDLYKENPYLNLSSTIKQTQIPYNVYAGLRGKLYHNISYNIRGNIKQENNKPLYRIVGGEVGNTKKAAYEYANAFSIDYADVSSFSGFGELSFDLNQLTIGMYGEYNAYKMGEKEYAYNLPEAIFGIHSLIQFTPKFSADLDMYYVSKRRDEDKIYDSFIGITTVSSVTMNGYVNTRAKLSYDITNRWNTFIQGNNLFNQKYDRYTNYTQRGLEVFAGVQYKF